MDARLSEIEIKLSFSEDLLEELNRTVARQQQQIAGLEQMVRDLRLQMQRSLRITSKLRNRTEIPERANVDICHGRSSVATNPRVEWRVGICFHA